jgi:hypothetical protein
MAGPIRKQKMTALRERDEPINSVWSSPEEMNEETNDSIYKASRMIPMPDEKEVITMMTPCEIRLADKASFRRAFWHANRTIKHFSTAHLAGKPLAQCSLVA